MKFNPLKYIRETAPKETPEVSEAEKYWQEARALIHNYVPDEIQDAKYLSLLVQAAHLGHLEALSKLAEYARRKHRIVEEYYWVTRMVLFGSVEASRRLPSLRNDWKMLGCPGEYENTWPGYMNMQGSFARAVLRLQSGIEVPMARKRLNELAQLGCEDAQQFIAARSEKFVK